MELDLDRGICCARANHVAPTAAPSHEASSRSPLSLSPHAVLLHRPRCSLRLRLPLPPPLRSHSPAAASPLARLLSFSPPSPHSASAAAPSLLRTSFPPPSPHPFQRVLAAAAQNKRAYAAAHGYGFAALPPAAIDPRRPPSWSKVPTLRARLHRYHWLFWNDADMLITNPYISLERILFSVIGYSDFDASPDLILTEDFNGVNAGLFFIRRSKWSENFLDTWWNRTTFVQFGSTKSGDNAALKHIIDHLSPEELQAHVRIAQMQCLFNSYPWMATWKSVRRLIFQLSTAWKGIVPCVLLLAGLLFIPESPRWLEYIESLRSFPKVRVQDLFLSKDIYAVIVGVGLMVFQQLGGINGVGFYASYIFTSAGFSGKLGTILIGIIQIPITLFGAILMDRSGRKVLLMVEGYSCWKAAQECSRCRDLNR